MKNEALNDDASKSVAYRKNNWREAIRFGLITFAIAKLLHIGWDAISEGAIDYKSSFWRSLVFSIAIAVSSMIIKFTPVSPK